MGGWLGRRPKTGQRLAHHPEGPSVSHGCRKACGSGEDGTLKAGSELAGDSCLSSPCRKPSCQTPGNSG